MDERGVRCMVDEVSTTDSRMQGVGRSDRGVGLEWVNWLG